MKNLLQHYRLRLLRKKWQIRTIRRKKDLHNVKMGENHAKKGGIFLFSTMRNEALRLPYFLEYYRNLGVDQFFIVDNGSTDGTTELLKAQPDVSLWHTKASYRRAKFGVLWLNSLLNEFGHKHWCLVVDVDELFVYPHHDTRPLSALTEWLAASQISSFAAMLIDLYPKEIAPYKQGQNPLETLTHFDAGNYTQRRNNRFTEMWIQGGPRQRLFFRAQPAKAPALNKTPLIFWRKHYVYISSTHLLLPRSLNQTYEREGGEKICGALLHTKFLPDLYDRASEELQRGEHYANSAEYLAYSEQENAIDEMWSPQSTEYVNWQQLDRLGLISYGGWA
ncbi:MAG: glycosyltransferase family 2 protein [Rhodobacteraceae bacterium]|nr:glycosyltransferase family 2 protein [Paracoccaceae bacterium]